MYQCVNSTGILSASNRHVTAFGKWGGVVVFLYFQFHCWLPYFHFHLLHTSIKGRGRATLCSFNFVYVNLRKNVCCEKKWVGGGAGCHMFETISYVHYFDLFLISQKIRHNIFFTFLTFIGFHQQYFIPCKNKSLSRNSSFSPHPTSNSTKQVTN